jgi:hypothetical protein
MPNEPNPRRDMTRERLTFPPHGRTSRNNKVIFAIFFVTIVAIMSFALYVTFNTDTRERTIDILNTETAEVYNTAAANSTSTAAAETAVAGGVTGGSPAVPTGLVSTPQAGSGGIAATVAGTP